MKKIKKFRVVLIPAVSCVEDVPLASGLLKAYAETDPFLRAGCEIVIFEHKGDFARVARAVTALKPDLVGFTVYGDLKRTLAAATAIKKACGAQVVVGGSFIGVIEKERIFAGGTVDFAVFGEGEITFAELLKAKLGRGMFSGIKGLAFAADGAVTVNPPRLLNPEIDGLPSPYLKGMFAGGSYAIAHIEASRGCIHACSYCSLPGTYRTFKFERVAAEIKAILRDFPGIRYILPTDSDFLYNKGAIRLLKFIGKELGAKGTGVELQVNLMNMTDAHIRHLNNKNFNVRAGIQSMHADTCKLVNRKMDLARTEDRLRALAVDAPNAKIGLSFIMGLPGDTLEKYKATLDWGLSLNASLSFFRLRVFPRSMLGRRSKELGVTAQKAEPFFVAGTASMNKEEMETADALTKELALPASVIAADKYFGFLFRYLCGPRGAPGFPRVELGRKLDHLIRRDRRFAGLVKVVSKGPEDNSWEMMNLQTLEPYRIPLIRALAEMAAGREKDGGFAGRFAGFAVSRILWDRLDGCRAGDIMHALAGGREDNPALVICSANSHDFFKWRFQGGGTKVLIEEKFDNIQFCATPEETLNVGRARVGGDFPPTLARVKRQFGLAVILQVFSAVAPADRVNFLKAVRDRVTGNGQLFIIHTEPGYPEFGTDWELTGGWKEYSNKELAADLEKAGWLVTSTSCNEALTMICAKKTV
ncbi:MAG: radical SAM protein [Elusimicrobiota bacterium]|nr:radical SAM protein [Elusimicrobiota bacterium]